MLKAKADGINPPDCWYYDVPETGKRMPASGNMPLLPLVQEVARHYKANGYAVPGNLREIIEDVNCRRVGAPWCLDESGTSLPPPDPKQPFKLSFNTFVQGTKAVGYYLLKGKNVNRTLSEKRAAVCGSIGAGCPAHQKVAGCAKCGGMSKLHNVVNQFIRGEKEPFDDWLQGCSICGCSLRLKVRLPLQDILKFMPQETYDRLPACCWMRAEMKEQENGK